MQRFRLIFPALFAFCAVNAAQFLSADAALAQTIELKDGAPPAPPADPDGAIMMLPPPDNTRGFATPPGVEPPPPLPPPPPLTVAQPEPSMPEPDEDEPWRDPWEGARFTSGPRVTFAVDRLDAERYGKTTGFWLGVDAVALEGEDDDLFGPAGVAGFGVGVNGDGNVPFDAHLGAGFGVILGPLRIAPLVGVGADTIGGGDGNTYSVDAALYWAVEGRARLGLGGVGLEVSGKRLFRGAIDGDRAADVPRETRLWGRAFTVLEDGDELFFGVTYAGYGDAKAFGGLIGYGVGD